MTKILHISDLHFRSDNKNNKVLLKKLDYIYKHYNDHIVIISGDLTDDGLEKQYDNAFQQLLRFNRLIIAPGNHDYGLLGNFYEKQCEDNFKNFINRFGNRFKLQYYGNEDVNILAIDSNLKTVNPFDFACGEISDNEFDLMDKTFQDDTIRTKIVVLHHHPFMHTDLTMKLKNDVQFKQKCNDLKIDITLFGHKHCQEKYLKDNRFYHASGSLRDEVKALEINVEYKQHYMNYIKVKGWF
jgi:3',5'-cyclic AMP phosphodiesterase CpdA